MKRRALRPLRHKHYVYGDLDVAWFVVRDPMAGRKNVYTVHRIDLTGQKETLVIGRELDLETARKVVRRDVDAAKRLEQWASEQWSPKTV